jgi:methionyl-tRNA formyltransferase
MTAGELHDLLMTTGADLMVETLRLIDKGEAEPVPQPAGSAKQAPRIFTEDCRINWNRPVSEVFNQVRGLSPYPGAFTTLNGEILKIYSASQHPANVDMESGTVDMTGGKLRFACTDGWLECREVQLQGKRKMTAADFLRGYRKPG